MCGFYVRKLYEALKITPFLQPAPSRGRSTAIQPPRCTSSSCGWGAAPRPPPTCWTRKSKSIKIQGDSPKRRWVSAAPGSGVPGAVPGFESVARFRQALPAQLDRWGGQMLLTAASARMGREHMEGKPRAIWSGLAFHLQGYQSNMRWENKIK